MCCGAGGRCLGLGPRHSPPQFGARELYATTEGTIHVWAKMSRGCEIRAAHHMPGTPSSWLIRQPTDAMTHCNQSCGERAKCRGLRTLLGPPKLSQLPCVLCDEFADGALLEGGPFLNPFAATFDSAILTSGR